MDWTETGKSRQKKPPFFPVLGKGGKYWLLNRRKVSNFLLLPAEKGSLICDL
jgi:hypothetical protein